jgi:hypothetical protein
MPSNDATTDIPNLSKDASTLGNIVNHADGGTATPANHHPQHIMNNPLGTTSQPTANQMMQPSMMLQPQTQPQMQPRMMQPQMQQQMRHRQDEQQAARLRHATRGMTEDDD